MAENEQEVIRNEETWHPSIFIHGRASFLFVPTAGVRNCPEDLVLELFREVFFKDFSGPDGKTKQLDPEEKLPGGSYYYSDNEKAVLYAARGRRKQTRQSSAHDYFAPLYPSLARNSWFRKQSDRVVRDFLFSGPLNQYFYGHGVNKQDELNAFIELVIKALMGHRAATPADYYDKEILSVTVKDVNSPLDADATKERIKKIVNGGVAFRSAGDDELANRVYQDFFTLCEAEDVLPRLQWIELLMTFLRIGLSAWLLSHVRITVFLRDWIIKILDEDDHIADDVVLGAIRTRNQGLFHPTLSPSREIDEHVERYMRTRVELNVLLMLVEKHAIKGLCDRVLVTTDERAGMLSLVSMLSMLKSKRKIILDTIAPLSARQHVTRTCEKFMAWKDPLNKGQGKNYREFLRVLYRAEQGDEGEGYLLKPVKRGRSTIGFEVFPGNLLLRTIVYLAEKSKEKKLGRGGKRKLILSDVEAHFKEYGLDFSAAAGARPRLIYKLQEIGLLKGSPDAGESAEVISPF